jgi:hypothetical protein
MVTVNLTDFESYEPGYSVVGITPLTADGFPLREGATYWDANGDSLTIKDITIECYKCADSGVPYFTVGVHSTEGYRVRWCNLYSFNPKESSMPQCPPPSRRKGPRLHHLDRTFIINRVLPYILFAIAVILFFYYIGIRLA